MSICLGWARGGTLRKLPSADLRHPWIPLLALSLQLAIFEPTGPVPFLRGHEIPVHVVSYAVLGTFFWLNRHLPGMALLAAGFACNALAILANGGLMPASEEALRFAGRWTAGREAGLAHNNSTLIGPHTKLWFLGDVFALPAALPFANVFSVGDVLLALGVVVLVPSLMGARPLAPQQGAVAAAVAGFLLGLLVGTTRVPAALGEAAADAPTAPPPATSPSPVAQATPLLSPSPTPAAPLALSTAAYTVQVGAFRARVNAEATVRRLRAQGYHARLVPGPLVRVWVGRFDDEPSARRLAEELARAGYPTFVRRAPTQP